MLTVDEVLRLVSTAEQAAVGRVLVQAEEVSHLLARVVDAQGWRAADGTLLAFGALHPHGEGALAVDRAHPALWAPVLDWLAAHGVTSLQSLEGDAEQRAALATAGWHEAFGVFDLERPAGPVEGEPSFGSWEPASARAAHDCVYGVWSDVEGHVHRPFDEWLGLFVTYDGMDPALQVVVRDGDEVCAIALCRIWEDGLGWISQLAVARPAQGQGLGRRVLTEAVRRLGAAGAVGTGLSVNAPNVNALGLYESLGFATTTAWITSRRG